MKRKTKTLLLIYLMWTVPSFAQSTFFDKYFATSSLGPDIGDNAIQLQSGNYLICAAEYDFPGLHPRTLIIKLNSKGDTLWSKLITTDTIGTEAVVMKQFKPNEFIIAGSAQIFKNNHFNVFNMSIDSNGNINWLKYVIPPSGLKAAYDRNILFTKNGEIIDVGTIADTSYGFDTSLAYVVKNDAAGNLIWQQVYGGAEFTDTRTTSIAETKSGFIIDGGSTIKDKFQTYDGYIAGIDSNGILLWQKFYGTYINTETFNGIMKMNDGNILLTGERGGPPPLDSTHSEWLMKIDSVGDSLWEELIGNDSLGKGYLWSSLNTVDGNICVIGGEIDSSDNIYHPCLIKLNNKGNIIWKHNYHYPNEIYDDYFYGFNQTSDSGFIIAGVCHPYTQSVWFLKLDQFGCDSVGCSEATGIEPVDESNFNSVLIYPNPVHTTFSISYHLPQNNSGEVEIFNLLGQRIYYATLSSWSSIHEIDAGKWANGIYEVKVSSPNQYATLKIVKE